MIAERKLYVTNTARLHSKGTFKPTTYTIHETQNYGATAKNERDNLQNNSGTTSFHSVVDWKEVVRCIPFNTGAWHARDGYGDGNMKSIALEICSSGLAYHFTETWNNAVEVVARDLLSLGWGVDRLRQHYDWCGKDCPKTIRTKGLWNKFKKDVQSKMEELKQGNKEKCAFPDAQKWVMEKGISDGTKPKENVTREQVWAMMYRAFMKGAYK